MDSIELLISPDGQTVRALYSDDFDFRDLGAELGELSIARAGRIEPTENNLWEVDLALSGGPVLPPFTRHEDAHEAERQWVREHALCRT